MKLGTLEWLRGAAALSVAVAHTDSLFGSNPGLPFGRWHSWSFPGTAGVEFFFVLSGFVMGVAHGSQLLRGGSVPSFLWRRACRIYPVYWLVLAVPVYRFWGAPSVTPGAIAEWASLLPVRLDNLVVVAWTLRQEVTFYLMLGLCLLPRIGPVVLVAWVAATTAAWFVAPLPLPGWSSTVAGHVFSLFNFEFFAGLAFGLVFRFARVAPGVGWLLLAAGTGVVAWRMSLDGWGVEYGPVLARPVYGVGYAAVILGFAVLERGGALRFGRAGMAAALAAGALSYPLYLSHLLTLDQVVAIPGFADWAGRAGPDGTFAALLLCTLAVAGLLAGLVDQPVQRAFRRLSRGRAAAGSA